MGFVRDLKNAIRQELGMPEIRDLKQPISNLDIALTGWQGDYSHSDYAKFSNTSKVFNELKRFNGKFTILRDGTLIPSLNSKLHTYYGKLDINEGNINRGPDTIENSPYRYYNLPTIELTKEGYTFEIHPDCFYNKKMLKLRDYNFLSRPHYTLEGLYDSLPSPKMSNKINALEEELLKRRGIKNESIVRRKLTKLKLLENKYRKFVSDQ